MSCRWGDRQGGSGEGNEVIAWEMGLAVGKEMQTVTAITVLCAHVSFKQDDQS